MLIPAVLYAIGHFANSEQTSQLAVAGSRDIEDGVKAKVNAYLPQFFRSFQRDFPHANLSLVSGLTTGGDATAQSLGIQHGVQTIGVNPAPINVLHKDGDDRLYRHIIGPGHNRHAVLSERKPTQASYTVDATDYLRRDQVIAGISGALLAFGIRNNRSGSMATVRRARKMDVPVFYLEGTVSEKVAAEMQKLGCYAVTYPEEMIGLLHQKPWLTANLEPEKLL